jgi:tRNA(fMet)-specific endonuclease VapC
MFLFDTDHLSIIQRRSQPEHARLVERMLRYTATEFFIPIISFHEQASGWSAFINRARDREAVIRGYQMFERLLSDFAEAQIISFDSAAADIFNSLRTQKVRIGTMDLRIAATALAGNLTLLSRNLVDFKQVPGLHVEDWTA